MTSDTSSYQLQRPDLHWDESGAPLSASYDDIYFSRENGLAETDWVFLSGNRLEERWRALDSSRPGLFVIGETGFGTGLNFLCAWRLWQKTAPPGWRLHFISVEKYPLPRADLKRALDAWPQLESLSRELVDAYPSLVSGFHSTALSGNTRLQLLFGSADASLDALLDSAAPELANGFAVDAWFLDGFAPAKNPEMWTAQLFNGMGRLSRPGTTLATFTAAGFVRRGLIAEGFDARRTPGFGSKREMLCGIFRKTSDEKVVDPTASTATAADAYKPPAPRPIDYWAQPPRALQPQRVFVIGGGLAGTSTARALAERGWPVTLLESESQLAAGASGNPQGVLYTKLSARSGALNRFALASYLHALNHYRRKTIYDDACGDFCGVLQLEPDNAQWRALATAFADQQEWVQFVDAARASELAQCEITQAALWFPRAGWLAPPRICSRQAQHPLIDIRLQCTVHALERVADGWLLHTSAGAMRGGGVVIATANAAVQLAPRSFLPLKPIRGQITSLPSDWLRAQPRTVICHDGYLTPTPAGGVAIGATFDQNDAENSVRADDHRRNLQALAQTLPQLLRDNDRDAGNLSGRVGFRCTTPDYLPIVGAVSEHALLRERCAALTHNARARIAQPHAELAGLYINVGHGSRGLTSTPLCAELLAAQIAGEPRPLPRDLAQALAPARFAIRNLIRGR